MPTPVKPPRHSLSRLPPLRGRRMCGFSYLSVSNDPGPGVLPRCNFISSCVDKIDFGIAAQYNLIPSFIKHWDIPLPWRGVRVLCTRTRWFILLLIIHPVLLLHNAP